MKSLPRGNGERVLLVDDDPASLYCIGDMLTRLGYEVTRAASTRSARAVLCDGGKDFDLIITDHLMRDMQDPNVVRGLRRNGKRLPVILMTGHTRHGNTLAGIDSNDVLFLPKPMGVRDLGIMIEEALRRTTHAGA